MTIDEHKIIEIPGDGPSIPEEVLKELMAERLAEEEAEAAAQRRANPQGNLHAGEAEQAQHK